MIEVRAISEVEPLSLRVILDALLTVAGTILFVTAR